MISSRSSFKPVVRARLRLKRWQDGQLAQFDHDLKKHVETRRCLLRIFDFTWRRGSARAEVVQALSLGPAHLLAPPPRSGAIGRTRKGDLLPTATCSGTIGVALHRALQQRTLRDGPEIDRRRYILSSDWHSKRHPDCNRGVVAELHLVPHDRWSQRQ